MCDKVLVVTCRTHLCGRLTAVSYLLRLVLPDRPGALGAVATALGHAGADIMSVDIIERSCELAFGTRNRTISGRDANELFSTLAMERSIWRFRSTCSDSCARSSADSSRRACARSLRR